MAKFKPAALLEGYAIRFISSYDPAIPADKRDWYAEDPLGRIGEVKLEGEPIPFYCHFPTQEEVAMALQTAGITYDAEGQTLGAEETHTLLLKNARGWENLARFCTDGIENLDDYDSAQAHTLHPSGLRWLSDAAISCLPTDLRRPILKEIGQVLFRRQQSRTLAAAGITSGSVLAEAEA